MLVYNKLSDYNFDCSTCPTRCDDKSKERYIFDDDAEFSGFFEKQVIGFINSDTPYTATKLPDAKNQPDIAVSRNGCVEFYIEIKVQTRAFMLVHKLLADGNLRPSTTLALNRSDFIHYLNFSRDNNQAPVYIMWALIDRPCIVGEQQIRFFYQKLALLEKLFNSYKNKRVYKRRQGEGDLVNGKILGVMVNYHFSITELKEWKPTFEPKLIQNSKEYLKTRKR